MGIKNAYYMEKIFLNAYYNAIMCKTEDVICTISDWFAWLHNRFHDIMQEIILELQKKRVTEDTNNQV